MWPCWPALPTAVGSGLNSPWNRACGSPPPRLFFLAGLAWSPPGSRNTLLWNPVGFYLHRFFLPAEVVKMSDEHPALDPWPAVGVLLVTAKYLFWFCFSRGLSKVALLFPASSFPSHPQMESHTTFSLYRLVFGRVKLNMCPDRLKLGPPN